MQKPIEAIPLAADDMPVIVTGIQSDPQSHTQEDILLIDDNPPPNDQGDHNIVLIHRDMLDNEEPTQASAWGTCEIVSVPAVQIIAQPNLGVRVLEPPSGREQASEEDEMNSNRNTNRNTNRNEDGEEGKMEHLLMGGQVKPVGNDDQIVVMDSVSRDLSEQQRASSNEEEKEDEKKKQEKQKSAMKKEKKKKRQEKRNQSSNPKAELVIVDVAMPTKQYPPPPPPPPSDQSNEIVVVDDHVEGDEYVDLSAQMIHDMNNGLFDVYVEDKNVHVTRFH